MQTTRTMVVVGMVLTTTDMLTTTTMVAVGMEIGMDIAGDQHAS